MSCYTGPTTASDRIGVENEDHEWMNVKEHQNQLDRICLWHFNFNFVSLFFLGFALSVLSVCEH